MKHIDVSRAPHPAAGAASGIQSFHDAATHPTGKASAGAVEIGKRSEEWWKNAIKDRCADHEKLMQHCLKAAVEEVREDAAAQIAALQQTVRAYEEACGAASMVIQQIAFQFKLNPAWQKIAKDTVSALASHRAAKDAQQRG